MYSTIINNIKWIQYKITDFTGDIRKSFKKKLEELGLRIKSPIDLGVESDGRVVMASPFCLKCNSKNVTKDGTRTIKLFGKKSKSQKYACKCGSRFATKIKGKAENDHHFKPIKLFSAYLRAIYNLSLRQVKGIFGKLLGYELSHESNRTWENSISNKARKIIKASGYSGYYIYDEQHVRINREWKYRQTIIDVISFEVIDERVVDTVDENSVSKFLIDTLGDREVIAITTDGETSYPESIKNLETHLKKKGILEPKKTIKQQRCTWHKQENLSKAISSLGKLKEEGKYDKLKVQIRLVFGLNDPNAIEECLEELGSETRKTVERLLEENKDDLEEAAKKIFNSIYIFRRNYPKSIKKQIESIHDEWEKFTFFYGDPCIPKTTNSLEQWYSYSSATKKRFKTKKGLEKHLVCRAFFKVKLPDLTLSDVIDNKELLSLL